MSDSISQVLLLDKDPLFIIDGIDRISGRTETVHTSQNYDISITSQVFYRLGLRSYGISGRGPFTRVIRNKNVVTIRFDQRC